MFLLPRWEKLDNGYINDICTGKTGCKRKIAFTLILYYTLDFVNCEALKKKMLKKFEKLRKIDKINSNYKKKASYRSRSRKVFVFVADS